MVVHVVSEAPLEMSTEKHTNSDEKKYVIRKNHVREITVQENKQPRPHSSTERDQDTPKSKKSKTPKKHITSESFPPIYQKDITNPSEKDTEISASDLEELRSVYNKCKSVLKKIESKYGHLLNLETNQNQPSIDTEIKECECSANTRIIFDDNGQQQIVTDTVTEDHICTKKVKRKYSDLFKPAVEKSNVEVEYEAVKLPDDLRTLQNMLQNPYLKATLRHEVINKIRTMKLERTNEIRFHRPSLKEQLKTDPHEVLEFNGSNLFKLPGYPDGK